jgi:hypothetical protein
MGTRELVASPKLPLFKVLALFLAGLIQKRLFTKRIRWSGTPGATEKPCTNRAR